MLSWCRCRAFLPQFISSSPGLTVILGFSPNIPLPPLMLPTNECGSADTEFSRQKLCCLNSWLTPLLAVVSRDDEDDIDKSFGWCGACAACHVPAWSDKYLKSDKLFLLCLNQMLIQSFKRLNCVKTKKLLNWTVTQQQSLWFNCLCQNLKYAW